MPHRAYLAFLAQENVMNLPDPLLDPEFLRELKEANHHVYYNSSFGFLNAHRGFRPGKIHTMIGVSGGGKSTLVRSIFLDFLKANPKKKVFVWLSEEEKMDLVKEIANTTYSEDHNCLSRLFIFSEIDNPTLETGAQITRVLDAKIREHQPDLVLFDNITTSIAYNDCTAKEQMIFSNSLKRTASGHNVPIFVVGHTGKNVGAYYDKIIKSDDIRGSSNIVNLSHYFYVMQSFFCDQENYSFVSIDKSRGHGIENKRFYIQYDPRQRIITQDKPISFEDFKLIYKGRDRLDSKDKAVENFNPLKKQPGIWK